MGDDWLAGPLLGVVLGTLGGGLVAWGLGQLSFGHRDGYAYCLLGVVVLAASLTRGLWGR